MRVGLIGLLAECPGPNAHALHTRFGECVAFLDGAVEEAKGDPVLAEVLASFRQFFLGDRG